MEPFVPIFLALIFSIFCLFTSTFIFKKDNPKISYAIAFVALIVSIIAVWISFHTPLGI